MKPESDYQRNLEQLRKEHNVEKNIQWVTTPSLSSFV